MTQGQYSLGVVMGYIPSMVKERVWIGGLVAGAMVGKHVQQWIGMMPSGAGLPGIPTGQEEGIGIAAGFDKMSPRRKSIETSRELGGVVVTPE
ncbi:hypothetical protein [Dechloromonas sp. A34]|uniref:hypothetical protein n=1 Tax=Dechloromonas sp. A34 TaxID=447588 RepID=UPI0022489E66|nr:hypothetical protein [Dechloromonas sp. A34]